jgi:predicted DNA-binding protein with PD1-like motif
MPVGALGRVAVHGLRTGSSFTDEVVRFASSSNIDYALISAIGSFSEVTLGYYVGNLHSYTEKLISDHVELVSCLGSLAKDEAGNVIVHTHASVSDKNGNVYAGHVLRAKVGYLVELYINEIAGTEITKFRDENSGLMLIRDEPQTISLEKS